MRNAGQSKMSEVYKRFEEVKQNTFNTTVRQRIRKSDDAFLYLDGHNVRKPRNFMLTDKQE